jgi:transcription antitermination factor NusG
MNSENFYKIDYPVWFAIYTKPNHEKKVDKILKTFKIESFLPTRIIRTKNLKELEVPLFRSYVFLKVIPRTPPFYIAMDIEGSLGYVKFNNLPSIIDEKEILCLKKLIDNSKDKVFPVYEIKEGKEIYFKSGPFKGYNAIVKKIDERRNLVIAWIKEIFAGGALEVNREEFLKWL